MKELGVRGTFKMVPMGVMPGVTGKVTLWHPDKLRHMLVAAHAV
jgi:hypothetical protein